MDTNTATSQAGSLLVCSNWLQCHECAPSWCTNVAAASFGAHCSRGFHVRGAQNRLQNRGTLCQWWLCAKLAQQCGRSHFWSTSQPRLPCAWRTKPAAKQGYIVSVMDVRQVGANMWTQPCLEHVAAAASMCTKLAATCSIMQYINIGKWLRLIFPPLADFRTSGVNLWIYVNKWADIMSNLGQVTSFYGKWGLPMCQCCNLEQLAVMCAKFTPCQLSTVTAVTVSTEWRHAIADSFGVLLFRLLH